MSSVALVEDFVSNDLARRFATIASAAVLLGSLASWFILVTASEQFIPATLLAYGPRFLLLLPVTLGAIASLVWARRSLLLYALAVIVVLVPIMGARTHALTGRGPIPVASPASIRVLSLNAQGGDVSMHYLPATLNELKPGLVDIQECGDALWGLIRFNSNFHAARHGNLCVLSRWPMSPVDSMPRAAFSRVRELGYGGAALVARYRISHPAGVLDFITLHLETPRKGFERLMGSDGFFDASGVPSRSIDVEGARINARIRRMESERASVWAARFSPAIPVIVAGDFNQPVESSIFREFWSRFDDAFEEAGFGFGYTKTENRWIRVRIDHVLYSPQSFLATGAWVGNEVGSDHRPLVADLKLVR